MKEDFGLDLQKISSLVEFDNVVAAIYMAIEVGTPTNMDLEYWNQDWTSIVPIEVFLNVSISLVEGIFLSSSAQGKVEAFLSTIMKVVHATYSTKLQRENLTVSEHSTLDFFNHGFVLM